MSFSKKHPYLAAVLMGLLCTFLTAIGSAVPQILGMSGNAVYLVMTATVMISAAVGLIIMKKSRFSVAEYGFRGGEKNSAKKVWLYLPLLAVEVIAIAIFGFKVSVEPVQIAVLALFTIAVGFNEEIYFRGLALKLLGEKGSRKAILWSSVIFGVLHLANVLSGSSPLYITVLQVGFAFLVGFCLAGIVSITRSLWIPIVWHALHNFISMNTQEFLDWKAVFVLALQVAILLVYAVVLWRKTLPGAPTTTDSVM